MNFRSIIKNTIKLLKVTKIVTKSSLIRLSLLTVIAGGMEVVAVGSVIPFVTAVINIDFVRSAISDSISLDLSISDNTLRTYAACLFCLALLMSMLVRYYLLRYQITLSYNIAHNLSKMIFKKTMRQSLESAADRSSSEFISAVAMKANLVVRQIILPGLQLITSVFIVFSMLAALMTIDPTILLIILLLYLVFYIASGRIVSKTVSKNSYIISDNSTKIIKIMQETFHAIKEVIITNRFEHHLSEFRTVDQQLKTAQSSSQIIGATPRYFIEFIGLSVMIAITTFYAIHEIVEPSILISTIAAFALGFQKITPVVQNMYNQYITIKTGAGSLTDTLKFMELKEEQLKVPSDDVLFHNSIRLNSIQFKRDNRLIISDLNFEIKKGDFVGIDGVSGAGKTTLMDILSGLMLPTSGELVVDGVTIDYNNLGCWRSRIAYVDQKSYFYEETLLFNITLSNDDIDLVKLSRITAMVLLDDVIDSIGGLNVFIGENGAKLSGGQKQRVAIARALYLDREILLLDEATNAVDKAVESSILQSLSLSSSARTIILISHDKENFRYCNKIIKLK